LFDTEGSDVKGRAVADWDVWPSELVWSPDAKALLVTAEVRGHVPVYRVDIETGSVERITATRAGGTHVSLAVSPDGKRVVGLRHTFTQPPEPFSVSLAAESEVENLGNVSGFDAELGARIAQIETFEVTAPDGERVQTFLLTPREHPAPHPLVLWVHGGPHSAWADGWHWRWNPLVPCGLRASVYRRRVEQRVGRRVLPRLDGSDGRRLREAGHRRTPHAGDGRLVRRIHGQLDRGQH
jgi:dipeptidyl aminopeptidase/acylaminoacyl peptidase